MMKHNLYVSSYKMHKGGRHEENEKDCYSVNGFIIDCNRNAWKWDDSQSGQLWRIGGGRCIYSRRG